MSFKPANMQTQRFLTEVWADGEPKLKISSSSWKSVFEQERLDKPYSAFVGELHRRLIRAAAPARFEQGSNPLLNTGWGWPCSWPSFAGWACWSCAACRPRR